MDAVSLEDIKKIIEENDGVTDNNWIFVLCLLLFVSFGNNGSADYWRGKYDALKEVIGSDEDK